MQEADGDALDVEPVLEGHVDQLHVEGEAVDPKQREERIGHVAADALEAALGIEEPSGHDRAHEAREDGRGEAALGGGLEVVRGARESAIADDDVEVAVAEVGRDDGEELGAEGEVDVGEDARLAAGGEHARPHSGPFSLVPREPEQGDA